MRKLFLLATILIVTFALFVSCKPTDAQAIITELEARISELEEENEQLKTGAEQKSDGEEEVVVDEQEEVAEEPGLSQKGYGSGMYIVKNDIEPGIYRSEGGVTYFERLAGLSGELDDILANEASPSGLVYVEIKSTDVAFKTEGSGKWYKIDLDEYKGVMLTSFEDGWYIVGKDIIPGRYRSDDGCDYWARLKDFSGELNSIIANDASNEGTVIVEIRSSDFGFQTQGANWEKIGEAAVEDKTEEVTEESEEGEATEEQQNVSNMQPIIDSATDSLGHIQPWSAAKDSLDDWPYPSPIIYIGDVMTFTINVSNSTNLQYRFQYQPSGGCLITIQDWSTSNVCTWTVPKEAFGKWIPIAAQVRNNDGLNFLGSCDDYANLTYTVLSK